MKTNDSPFRLDYSTLGRIEWNEHSQVVLNPKEKSVGVYLTLDEIVKYYGEVISETELQKLKDSLEGVGRTGTLIYDPKTIEYEN